MKLLMCNKCMDIFNLKREEKTCSCGETKGRYIDSLNAEISGDCQPIGFSNESFIRGQWEQKEWDKKKITARGVQFTAFFIPELAKSIKRTK